MKAIVTILLFLTMHCILAQNFDLNRFRIVVDANTIPVLANEKSSAAEFTVNIEPGYSIGDRWLVGLRYEVFQKNARLVNLTKYATYATTGRYEDKYFGAGFCAFSQYYFLDPSAHNIIPFVGLGIGWYRVPGIDILLRDSDRNDLARYEIGEKNRLGFYPSVGVEYDVFYLRFDYNFIASSGSRLLEVYDNYFVQPTSNPRLLNNYFSLKLGFFFGRGKERSITNYYPY